MQMNAILPTLTELFALCALSALMGALLEGERAMAGLRTVFSLAIALTLARLAAQMLGS